MALSGFPNKIQVVLGSAWTGQYSLDPGDLIILTKVPGQNTWSENGTANANTTTNRIALTFNSSTSSQASLRGVSYGYFNYLGTITKSSDSTYTFSEIWNDDLSGSFSSGSFYGFLSTSSLSYQDIFSSFQAYTGGSIGLCSDTPSYNKLYGLGQNTEDTSLLGWWKLQESVGTTAYDSSDNGSDGTMFNMGSNPTISGGPTDFMPSCITFNGTDQYIDISSSDLPSTGPFTVLARINNTGPSQDVLFGPDSPWFKHGSTNGYGFYVRDNKIYIITYFNSNTNTNHGINYGQWYHVGISRDSSMKLFVQGSGQGSFGGNYNAASDDVWIGRNITGDENGYFEGGICDLSFFSRALSDDEMYEAYAGPEPINLVKPELHVNGISWSGSVGEWDSQNNGDINYQWELIRTYDSNIAFSGSDQFPNGTLDLGDSYYLNVRALNSGGYDCNEESISNIVTAGIRCSNSGEEIGNFTNLDVYANKFNKRTLIPTDNFKGYAVVVYNSGYYVPSSGDGIVSIFGSGQTSPTTTSYAVDPTWPLDYPGQPTTAYWKYAISAVLNHSGVLQAEKRTDFLDDGRMRITVDFEAVGMPKNSALFYAQDLSFPDPIINYATGDDYNEDCDPYLSVGGLEYYEFAKDSEFVFDEVPLPSGAVIKKALLSIDLYEDLNIDDSYVGLATYINGASGSYELPNVSPTGCNYDPNITQYQRGDKLEGWIIPSGLANQTLQSPDISCIIQEYTNELVWESGRSLNLFINNDSSRNFTIDGEYIYDYMKIKPSSAKLSLWWGPLPLPASGLSAVNGVGGVDLTWFDNSSDEEYFELNRDTDSNFTSPAIFSITQNQESYTDTTIDDNTTYYYRIRPVNVYGSGVWSNKASITTPTWIPANSGVDFFIEGHETSQNNLDLFVGPTVVSSGSIDFFIEGNLSSSNSISLYTGSSSPGSGFIDFYTGSFLGNDGELDFVTKGIGNNNQSLGLYIQGRNPDTSSGNLNLYTYSTENSGVRQFLNLTTKSWRNPLNSINLYVKAEDDNSIKASGYFDLFIGSASNSGRLIDMYLNVADGINDSLNMYVIGKGSGVDNSFDMYMYGKDNPNSDIDLFTRGF